MNRKSGEGQGQQPINKYVCPRLDMGVHNKGVEARPCHYPMPRRWLKSQRKKESLTLCPWRFGK